MRRDLVVTIGGMILVGLIVVATFLYGNQQHQAELRLAQEQQRQATPAPPAAATATDPMSSSSKGTAAVQPPAAANTLQGGASKSGSGSSPAPATAQTPVLNPAQLPPTQTPKTGGSTEYLVGTLLVAWLARGYLRSRAGLARAQRLV